MALGIGYFSLIFPTQIYLLGNRLGRWLIQQAINNPSWRNGARNMTLTELLPAVRKLSVS